MTGQDDFACMAETIRRRYSRLKREVGPASSLTSVQSQALPKPNEAESEYRQDARPTEEGDEAPESRPTSPFDAVVHDAANLDELTAPWVPKTPSAARLPDLILIDGGRGQLNAACAELAKLGVPWSAMSVAAASALPPPSPACSGIRLSRRTTTSRRGPGRAIQRPA